MSECKARPCLILDEDFPLLALLRSMFIGKAGAYSIDDLADELGISSFSLYKQFGADRPLRADVLLAALCYVNRKNRHDRRLINYINELIGCEPRLKSNGRVRRAMEMIEGQLADLFEGVKADNREYDRKGEWR